jgi:DNA mismatch repair protein PMS2
MLQRNTVLRTQPLIAPLSLDLSPGDEEILEQRAAIFSKSGFNFQFDDSERPGRRARLITVPFSHNVQLGPADVQEMLFLLKDNVCQLCRPSRITSMFASRACRSAIMIGDSLPLPQMRKVCLFDKALFSSHNFFQILHQLSRLDQPWNCPHGRPTMRHLFVSYLCPRHQIVAHNHA